MNSKYILATGTIAALLTAAPVFADSDGGDGHKGFFSNFGLGGSEQLKVESDNSGSGKGIGAQVRILAQEDRDGASTTHGIGSLVKSLAHMNRDNDDDNDKHKKGDDRDDHATSTATTTVNANIAGQLTAINGTTLTLSGKNGATFTVDAAKASISGAGQTKTLADLKVGDTLVVRGTLNGSVITATSIVDKAFVKSFIKAINDVRAGVVSALTSTGFSLNPFGTTGTTTVTTNGSTTVLLNGSATSSSAIATGTNVLVFGTSSTSTPNSITASFVVILQNGLNFLRDLLQIR